jgi:hypothetical protein
VTAATNWNFGCFLVLAEALLPFIKLSSSNKHNLGELYWREQKYTYVGVKLQVSQLPFKFVLTSNTNTKNKIQLGDWPCHLRGCGVRISLPMFCPCQLCPYFSGNSCGLGEKPTNNYVTIYISTFPLTISSSTYFF